MKTLNLTLSIAAGLVGGCLTSYFATSSVHAEEKTVALKTVDAQAFRLMNAAGTVAGTFDVDASGKGVINLFDANGRPIWTSDSSKPVIKPVAGR